ncbi:unnamed protein product, partial [marine sediment metagenome]
MKTGVLNATKHDVACLDRKTLSATSEAKESHKGAALG